jgi:glucose-1-phosphate adenylyltransferase
MQGRVLGIIVAGGCGGAVDVLGGADDAALTPFAARFRFVDFALATLANSGVQAVYVVAPEPSAELRAHLARAERPHGGRRRPSLVPLRGAASAPRAARIVRALNACRAVIRAHDPEAIVVLTADHILQLDLRPLCAAHAAGMVDVTLAGVPEYGATSEPQWTGDLVLRTKALPEFLRSVATHDAAVIAAGNDRLDIAVFDIRDAGSPCYWHEPSTLEAYYDAHMNLCTARPALDLYDPGWPLPAIASGLAPAKVMADTAGRCGQALNTLVSDGSLIRGGVVVNGILGHGVVVDSGAEVEDSVLLDGCRIGRGARVRRAVVGAGAIVGDGEEIGFGSAPPAAVLFPSGLTFVGARPVMLAAASGSS